MTPASQAATERQKCHGVWARQPRSRESVSASLTSTRSPRQESSSKQPAGPATACGVLLKCSPRWTRSPSGPDGGGACQKFIALRPDTIARTSTHDHPLHVESRMIWLHFSVSSDSGRVRGPFDSIP